MRAPLSWLKDFVTLRSPSMRLVHRMTMAGLEVGEVEHIGADWQRDKLFVGEVTNVDPHPNADRLVAGDGGLRAGRTADSGDRSRRT